MSPKDIYVTIVKKPQEQKDDQLEFCVRSIIAGHGFEFKENGIHISFVENVQEIKAPEVIFFYPPPLDGEEKKYKVSVFIGLGLKSRPLPHHDVLQKTADMLHKNLTDHHFAGSWVEILFLKPIECKLCKGEGWVPEHKEACNVMIGKEHYNPNVRCDCGAEGYAQNSFNWRILCPTCFPS